MTCFILLYKENYIIKAALRYKLPVLKIYSIRVTILNYIIYIYRQQMKMLMEAGKCSSLVEDLPLIQVRSVMKYMPQFKYMFNRGDMVMPSPAHSSEEHPAKKRQRTS